MMESMGGEKEEEKERKIELATETNFVSVASLNYALTR